MTTKNLDQLPQLVVRTGLKPPVHGHVDLPKLLKKKTFQYNQAIVCTIEATLSHSPPPILQPPSPSSGGTTNPSSALFLVSAQTAMPLTDPSNTFLRPPTTSLPALPAVHHPPSPIPPLPSAVSTKPPNHS
ncbi:hypothetical protein ACJQWK_02001 [Exserohilum turcicum]